LVGASTRALDITMIIIIIIIITQQL